MNAQAKKNASAAAATATEAIRESTPQKVETGSNLAKKKQIRKPGLRWLKFPLDHYDVIAKCEGASKKTRALAELEAELARTRDSYKGRIEKLKAEISADLKCVEEKSEDREVMADEVHDFETCKVRIEYKGSIYSERDMTPRERQLVIEGVGTT
jgi:hypothetical protein